MNKDETSLTSLIEAAKTGDERTVRDLIARDPSLVSATLSSGDSPLMAALYRGQRHIIDVLVDAGARIDVFAAAALGRTEELRAGIAERAALARTSFDGWTPLHLASFFGHQDAAALLLETGAPVSAVSSNTLRNTPLHAATAGGHADVALLLIEHGADVNAADAGGHTPLHIAAENGLTAVVKALLARGADPLAVDAEDKTPLSRAAAKNHNEVIDAINLERRV